MLRTAALLLLDIQDALDRISGYLAGVDRAKFLSESMRSDAVIRQLTILGEAVSRLPDTFTADHPDIPWRSIAGLRNRVVHAYFQVDLELLWSILENDLSAFRRKIEPLIPVNPDSAK